MLFKFKSKKKKNFGITAQFSRYIVDDKLTPYGTVLLTVDQEFQEQAIIILEMIRIGHLSGERLITTQNNLPYNYEKEIALLTRVFTMCPVEFHKKV